MSAPKWLYDKFHNKYSNEEAVVLYSSGTTGNSKGVILSHYAINTNADAIFLNLERRLNKMKCLKPLTAMFLKA